MGSVPGHPFFKNVLNNLHKYNRNWYISYVTVMYNTGPLFLSVIWKEYMPTVKLEEDRVRILMPAEYNDHPWSFFGVYKGSSWHRSDAKAIFWMGQHWLLVTVAGFALAASLYLCGFYAYRRVHLRDSNYSAHASPFARFSLWSWPWGKNGYKPIKHEV